MLVFMKGKTKLKGNMDGKQFMDGSFSLICVPSSFEFRHGAGATQIAGS